MLASVGKLSSIGEILTISVAASELPGERQTNDFDSFVSSVHFGGTVHDRPCRSHLICCPPASAAVCSVVAWACSADLAVAPPVPDELEASFLTFPERLQRERVKPSSSRTRRFFMFVVLPDLVNPVKS